MGEKRLRTTATESAEVPAFLAGGASCISSTAKSHRGQHLFLRRVARRIASAYLIKMKQKVTFVGVLLKR